jgi:tellurite resistance protein
LNQEVLAMMTSDQIDVFARGLYHVANVDGIDPKELALINEFLEEVGATDLVKTLPQSTFHVAELAALETKFLKRVFLKTCLVLARRDGVVSDAERMIVAQIAAYLGMMQDVPALEAEAAKASL